MVSSSTHDLIILGAGISGLTFAHYAAKSGYRSLVLEKSDSPGGCIHTARTADGFWFELGTHTLYNSYGKVTAIIAEHGLKDRIQRREKAPYRLFVDGKVRTIPSQLALGELFASAWRIFAEHKTGRTVADYYGRLVGERNWQHVFSPLLSAVPCQRADDFPAEMLFKRRPRRKDFPRTFTLQGGLGGLVDRLVDNERICVETNAAVTSVARAEAGFVVTASDRAMTARRVVLAVPPDEGSRLLAATAPGIAAALGAIRVAPIVSTGVVFAKDDLRLPRIAGLVPLGDVFFSAVSRDVVPDPRLRALAFHFRAGLSPKERARRIADVTATPQSAFAHVVERAAALPSPTLGHADIVRSLDASLPGTGIYITGNYFGGLSVEDCVLRSAAEVSRLQAEDRRA